MKMTKQKFYLMVADVTGDTRIMIEWDPKNPKSVEEMQNRFTELKNKGYIFFECEGFEGEYKTKGMPVKTFNESTGRLVGEQYFENMEHCSKEEVILTKTVKDTEANKEFDPEKNEPKDESTYGAVKKNVLGG